mmetsp:Transcript_20573/g.51389  ORF Transcript_20573/g.51389 Transcript_20573/m.51389 type:complete len:275 (-) Transcript_20573:444-1268(-)
MRPREALPTLLNRPATPLRCTSVAQLQCVRRPSLFRPDCKVQREQPSTVRRRSNGCPTICEAFPQVERQLYPRVHRTRHAAVETIVLWREARHLSVRSHEREWRDVKVRRAVSGGQPLGDGVLLQHTVPKQAEALELGGNGGGLGVECVGKLQGRGEAATARDWNDAGDEHRRRREMAPRPPPVDDLRQRVIQVEVEECVGRHLRSIPIGKVAHERREVMAYAQQEDVCIAARALTECVELDCWIDPREEAEVPRVQDEQVVAREDEAHGIITG